MTSMRSRLTVAALLTLVAVTAVQTYRLDRTRERSAELALHDVNRTAAADTTHEVALENPAVAELLGDSVRLFAKKVVQVRQEKDVLTSALGTERIAKAGMAVTIDSLRHALAAATEEDSSTRMRRAAFDLRQAPYTIAAAVELPPAPDTGHMDLRIALDRIPVVARLSCAPPNGDGIRAASIDATTPAWASIDFTDVEQSPDLCRSPALEPRSTRGRTTGLVVASLLAGYVIGK